MAQRFQDMSTRAKIVTVAIVTALLAGAAPALAHGVEHALYAHNADKVDGIDSAGLKSRVTQAKKKVASFAANETPVSIATATITAPAGGGALVMDGMATVGYVDSGTIGAIFISTGSGCGAGAGDAWFDTDSTWVASPHTTVTQTVAGGARTVHLCGIASNPVSGQYTDTSVPLLGAGLTVLWVPQASNVAALGHFGTLGGVKPPPTVSLTTADRVSMLHRAAAK